MDRERAMMIVLAEAFSETGLAVLLENGEDPGRERINSLIQALAFLTDALADEDSFDREFVSALFVLGNRVPDLLRRFHPSEANSRASMFDQAEELTITVSALIENWNNWPDLEAIGVSAYSFEAPSEESTAGLPAEQVGGYRHGDVTYCVLPNAADCFPVRVESLGNGFLDITPLVDPTSAYAQFLQDTSSRRFFYPHLSPGSRLGGEDERLVNAERKSGPELRLLPVHYASKTLDLIRQRHADDPFHWPLPTGIIFDRWFQDVSDPDR